jgi:ATPase subunit of ABC transporter with duplicated ATPase domains
MDEQSFQLTLQEPFNEKQFSVTLGEITWLVGPNGSGKTRFADALIGSLGGYGVCRLLKADRLAGLEIHRSGYFSTGHFNQGFAKNSFNDLKNQAAQYGYGADAIVLLEEDRALRAIVEATLSQIFERRVLFEWDSGILQPRVLPRGKSGAYLTFPRLLHHGQRS